VQNGSGKSYSIRSRTALFIAAAFALFLTVFFLFSYISIGNALRGRSDDEARTELRSILVSAEDSSQQASIAQIIERHILIGEARLRFEIFRKSGTKLSQFINPEETSASQADLRFLSSVVQDTSRTFHDDFSGKTYRELVLHTQHYLGLVKVDQVVLEEAQEAMLKQFGILLLIGIAISALLGYLVAGISLSPVLLLIDAAKRLQAPMTAQNPVKGPRLLPVPKNVTEVALLATAVNRLIEERETSIEQLRNFTADAAHELRTPLTVLKGELEVEIRLIEPSNPSLEVLQSNLEEVERLSAIVDDLLLLARLDQREAESQPRVPEISVRETVHSALRRLASLAGEKNVKVEEALDGDFTVEAIPERFERMLLNVLQNAVLYSNPGGEVDVELHSYDTPPTIVIRDHGIGISEEVLPLIFERFYRADKSRSRAAGGSGLGLAIAKSIAQQSGCNLLVESKLGIGTIMTFAFPSDAFRSAV
jgi:signal transduction histidine kinase